MKKFLLIIGLVFISIGMTEVEVSLSPTKDNNGGDLFAKNTTKQSASVTQTIELILPKATALHLGTPKLTFDLRALDGTDWANRVKGTGKTPAPKLTNMVCVYGTQDTDQTTTSSGPNFWNQTSYNPNGTSYTIDKWPNIKVKGKMEATTYPALRVDKKGELIKGSKNYFVCYKSFILQKFSNFKYWDLTATHEKGGTKGGIKELYIQDNPCDNPKGLITGMYKLNQGDSMHLVPKNLNAGTTGDRAANSSDVCGHKSWLDDLVVVAIKINGEQHGKTASKVTYTLTSSDTQFP